MSQSVQKVKRIIEYQPKRQRTPKEAVQFLADEIDRGECTHMLVIYRDEKGLTYFPASEKRDYRKSQILWDTEQWKNFFLNQTD